MPVDGIRKAIRELDLMDRHLLVAVSGGVDSMVLLDGLLELRESHGLELAVGHVHHGLRGAEADADEALVLETAARLGLKAQTYRVDPHSIRSGCSNRVRPTLQEAARTLRYEALTGMLDRCGADHLATAHNLDDQAETLLMRLFRGTAPSGLGGIPERSADGLIVRPLLGISRSAIEAHARNRGLRWREDISNASDNYTRNRIRNHWIPGLIREFNPQLLNAIGGLAESQRREEIWISEIVETAARRQWSVREADPSGSRDRALEFVDSGWEEMAEGLAYRLMARAMREMGAGRDIRRVHLERMFVFLRKGSSESGRQVELPGGLRLKRLRKGYRLWRTGI